jgi:hypothetical protein
MIVIAGSVPRSISKIAPGGQGTRQAAAVVAQAENEWPERDETSLGQMPRRSHRQYRPPSERTQVEPAHSGPFPE